MPTQATPTPGYHNSSTAFLLQTPALNGPYRIQKPSQRYGSSVDAQAITRALHAEQWAEQPIYGSFDPQQQFSPAAVHVAPYARGSQHQQEYHNATCVRNSGPSSQGDVSLSQQEFLSKLQAERPLRHEHSAAGHRTESVTGMKEESCDVSKDLGLKDHKNGAESVEQSTLSKPPGVLNMSLGDPGFGSHRTCCHGKSHVQTTQPEGSGLLILDSSGLPEYTVLGQVATNSQSVTSMQDEVLKGTNRVSDHAKQHVSITLADRPQHHGNEQTTSYTTPPTYTTASRSLEPAQLSFLHPNPYLHSQKVPQHAPCGSNGSATPLTGGNAEFTPAHNCNCGDTCDCLGCAAHPYNTTTRNHVQSLGDLLAHDDNEQQPGSPPQPPYDGSLLQFTDVHSMTPGINTRLFENVLSPPVSSHDRSSILPLAETEVTSSAEAYSEAHVPTFSSSGYYTMEFPMDSLGGCTDVSGSCQCGDDCACVGCLTHTGHNGIPLDLDSAIVPPSPNGVDTQQDLNENDGYDVSASEECCN